MGTWNSSQPTFIFPKSARAYLFSPICQNHSFCSGPISADPICPQSRRLRRPVRRRRRRPPDGGRRGGRPPGPLRNMTVCSLEKHCSVFSRATEKHGTSGATRALAPAYPRSPRTQICRHSFCQHGFRSTRIESPHYSEAANNCYDIWVCANMPFPEAL